MGGRGASFTYARDLISRYDISDITDSKNKIVDFYRYTMQIGGVNITRDDDGQERLKVRRPAMERAEELASELAARIEIRDDGAVEAYQDIRSMLHGPFYLSAQDRRDIPDFSAYARSSENRLRLTTNSRATSLNSAYTELAERYPGYFSDDVRHPADQLQEINRVLNRLRNSTIPISNTEREGMRDELTMDLLRSYAGILRQRRKTTA